MINKFYSIDTGLDEVNCFSAYEVYCRMIVARVPKNKVQNIMQYVHDMQPNDYIVVAGEDFGRVEIRCWTYYND